MAKEVNFMKSDKVGQIMGKYLVCFITLWLILLLFYKLRENLHMSDELSSERGIWGWIMTLKFI